MIGDRATFIPTTSQLEMEKKLRENVVDLYHQWQERIDQMAEERAERNGTTPDQERRNIMAVYQRAASNAKKRRRP